MSDLISKKAVMEELLVIQDGTYMSTCLTVDECKGKRWMIARAINAVKDAPTIDAEPVKHGHWIEQEAGNLDTYYTCSACKEDFCLIEGEPSDNLWNYCPNCGAKMDEEVTGEQT